MMHIFQEIQLLYSLAGFAVGVLVGLTGVGGGSLMTPLLILLFGIHPAVAVGTDLLYAAVTKTAGTAVHSFNGSIDWSIVRRLSAGSVPATIITLLLLKQIGISSVLANAIITIGLAFALFITALALIFRKAIAGRYADTLRSISPNKILIMTVAVGAVMGALVSVSSVGAGAIGVTALVLLYPNLPTARIVGSDIAHAVPITLIAGAGHWALGSVDGAMLLSLLVGSIPGIVIGSYMTIRTPETTLRFALAIILMVVGAKLALSVPTELSKASAAPLTSTQ
jgi:uncharacterized membrane protein YfcA